MTLPNIPSQAELLRRVAAAAAWAIRSNRDDPVGRDGRCRVGVNWVKANATLNEALRDLHLHYPEFADDDQFNDDEIEAIAIDEQLRRRSRT